MIQYISKILHYKLVLEKIQMEPRTTSKHWKNINIKLKETILTWDLRNLNNSRLLSWIFYDWQRQKKNHLTSALESVSASLCLMSLAIEKKTSSTFRFVFALCNRQPLQDTQTIYCINLNVKMRKYIQSQRTWCHIHQQELGPLKWGQPEKDVSYQLNDKNYTKKIIKHTNINAETERKSEGKQTLLLSSMSALLPTRILFTLSDACCSILRIQFLMSENRKLTAKFQTSLEQKRINTI